MHSIQSDANCNQLRAGDGPSSVFPYTFSHGVRDGQSPITANEIFVPLVRFSVEPMTRDQCRRQFTANCHLPGYGSNNCTAKQGLTLHCSRDATPQEVQQLAASLSKPPIKAMRIDLFDGEAVTFANLSPVREQTVIFYLNSCQSHRATDTLSVLRFPQLLEFGLRDCRDLDVRRSDFWHSSKLRLITFYNTALRLLEAGTFSDLPGLRLLALERGFSTMQVFDADVRDYLARLHCGCEFQWFRDWWRVNGLWQQAAEGDVYDIPYDSWRSDNFTRKDVFLSVNCAQTPFPNGSAAVDFVQEVYSANELSYSKKAHPACPEEESAKQSFPVLTTAPGTEEECRLFYSTPCWSLNFRVEDCKQFGLTPTWNDDCDYPNGTAQEVRRMVPLLAKLDPRPIRLMLTGESAATVIAADLAPVRERIMVFNLVGCIDTRPTKKINEYDLFNALDFWVANCADIDVKRADFQRSRKLRIIVFWNCTIRSLEVDAFGDLPDLRIVSLEYGVYTSHKAIIEPAAVFEERHRDYLWRLHCGCEFVWFRRWWRSQPALLRTAVEQGDVYTFCTTWRSGWMSREDIYVPIDCAVEIPTGADTVDLNQTDYSRNENC
ncbi:uncharacterized protein LOC129595225 [Paramacrobiotus metropolitanus]|uniref:uncharacterized protein LOC129595225 n=1 Tax=Paramacrobiotus metropolitanus TaxID=2943436 RepID=UPI0024465706|nr:uncharacterized protein LOC129595225 [Paramacrobiotus metropolitanus]